MNVPGLQLVEARDADRHLGDAVVAGEHEVAGQHGVVHVARSLTLPHLQLVEARDADRQLGDAVVAGEREVSHIGQVQHALRERAQAPFDLLRARLGLGRLVAVQHQLLQLAQARDRAEVGHAQRAADALEAQHLRSAGSQQLLLAFGAIFAQQLVAVQHQLPRVPQAHTK